MITIKSYCYRLLRNPRNILSKAIRVWHREGFSGLKQRIMCHDPSILYTSRPLSRINYNEWIKLNDMLDNEDLLAIKKHIGTFKFTPLISVIMPVYNTQEKWLRLAIESVQKQLYTNWELCIADDASSLPHVRRILEQYSEIDPRIKVVFREKTGHISAASNSALELASGEFVALMDHDDELPAHALYMVAVELNLHPGTDLIYSDDDRLDKNGRRYAPHFKSEWNNDLFYAQNYFSHLGVYRKSLIQKVGGFREGFEGSQDYDLCLRCIAQTDDQRIRHIPHILYHWRSIPGSAASGLHEKPYAESATLSSCRDYFNKIDPNIKVVKGEMPNTLRVLYPLPKNPPLVTLIIPTRDRRDLLAKCVSSIRNKTTYQNYEILIVDNQSKDSQTLLYLEWLEQEGRVRIVTYDNSFNYSAIINFAVRQVYSELIGLLHDDSEVINPEWLDELVSHAIRPEIGAVGAKLYYPNNKIQHGGIVLGSEMLADCAYRYSDRDDNGYFGRLKLPQRMSAVNAACLVMRRSVFIEVNEIGENEIPNVFFDVDLCLRIRKKGYFILWTPYSELYHHEFSSRGSDGTNDKTKRPISEIAHMRKHWGKMLENDPFYNPNLSIDQADYTLSIVSRALKPWKIKMENNGE